jgi:D-arabinose 1-dehydrogenase-like Zn-dependent alcohol dehydrogenase
LSRVCRRCEFCLAGAEQYCAKSTNHLHHEDGSFQEYIALDADNLTILPDDVDAKLIGPVLCAGVTAYKVCSTTCPFKTVIDKLPGCAQRKHQSRRLGCCCRCWRWSRASCW